jgi:catechol-2,3-dioxygenase
MNLRITRYFRRRGNEHLSELKNMNQQITGLHHVTAVTGDAAANLTFYTQVLGLRLVKKTVPTWD